MQFLLGLPLFVILSAGYLDDRLALLLLLRLFGRVEAHLSDILGYIWLVSIQSSEMLRIRQIESRMFEPWLRDIVSKVEHLRLDEPQVLVVGR